MTTEKTAATGESSTAEKTVVAPGHTTLEQFSKIMADLGGAKKEPTGENPGTGDKPAPKSKPKSLKALAEALELEDADVYAVEIPSSRAGEKPYTLGGLKDLAADRDQIVISNLKLDEDRRTHERERVAAEEELREMLRVLPPEAVKPEAMARLRAGLEKKRTRERELILEGIPEWQDEKIRTGELAGIVEHLKGYGVPETFLLTNLSANVFRMLRDTWQLSSKVSKALAAVEERKTPPRPQSKTGEKPPKAPPVDPRANAHTAGRVQGQVADFIGTIKQAATRR